MSHPSSDSGQRLTLRQKKAISALLSEPSQQEAAAKVGCARQTLMRWLRQPDFAAALHQAETELISGAVRRLLRYTDPALTVIATLMASPDTPPAIRLRAAIEILDKMVELRTQFALEERISRLEQAYAERSPEPSSPARTRTERSERVHVNGASAAQHR